MYRVIWPHRYVWRRFVCKLLRTRVFVIAKGKDLLLSVYVHCWPLNCMILFLLLFCLISPWERSFTESCQWLISGHLVCLFKSGYTSFPVTAFMFVQTSSSADNISAFVTHSLSGKSLGVIIIIIFEDCIKFIWGIVSCPGLQELQYVVLVLLFALANELFK